MKPQGKVATIVDEYSFIANIGKEDGVEENHRYIVYTLSDEIEDPDSGEVLGQIEYKKAIVKPAEIKEKMTVMESAERSQSILQTQLSPMTGSQKKLTKNADFDFADDEVKKGDLIKFHEEVDKTV